MQPTRDPGATLPDLLEVLLNKGVHLNLDLIISVADVPLIGVNLRATIAGIETMIEYGMMRQWDEQTRAWVQRSLTRELPMAPGEEVVAAMAASYYQDDFYRAWRPGRAYLTTKRLILHRRDPAETLWQAELGSITAAEQYTESSLGGADRTRLRFTLSDGSEERISALDSEHLLSLIRKQLDLPAPPSPEAERQAGPKISGSMWYLETFAQGATWRGGRATLTHDGLLTWKSPMDNRASLRIEPTHLTAALTEERSNPTDHSQVLLLETTDGDVHLASPDLRQWTEALADHPHTAKEMARGTSGE